MGVNILFISVKKKANMSLHREHRVYACDISSIVEMHVTTIMLFLPKKGIDALMLVAKTLRKLIRSRIDESEDCSWEHMQEKTHLRRMDLQLLPFTASLFESIKPSLMHFLND